MAICLSCIVLFASCNADDLLQESTVEEPVANFTFDFSFYENYKDNPI